MPTKNHVYLQLATEKKTSYHKEIFVPSYFVTALAHKLKFHSCFVIRLDEMVVEGQNFRRRWLYETMHVHKLKVLGFNFFYFASPRGHVLI